MIWSLLYDALSAHYSRQECAGEINDDQLGNLLVALQNMDKQALYKLYACVYKVTTPEDL